MDGQLYTILGAISSLLFGLYVCLVDFETFHGPGKWREFLGLAISLLIVYLSSVVAVRGYPWSFMFGAGVIALIAIHRYGGIDASHAHHLPLESLAHVFHSRPSQRTWLNYEEFKTECLFGVTIRNIEDFSKNGINLLLVDTSDVEHSREWFVENALSLQLFERLSDKELVDLVRFIWKYSKLNQALRQDCTLDAASRLEKQLAKVLCFALSAEHPADRWIKKELKCHRENGASTEGLTIRPIESLNLQLWYQPGNVAECRLCGYRLARRPMIPVGVQTMFYRLVPYPHECDICGHRVLAVLPLERSVAESPSANIQTQLATDNDTSASFSVPVEPSEAV